jgi:serine O-acetyltransferase
MMIKKILYILLVLKFFPFVLFYISSKERIISDITSFSNHYKFRYNNIFTLVYLLEKIPEFRNVFYLRYRKAFWLRFLFHGVSNLYFFVPSEKVGKGLMLWHGYSTSVNAISIGDNCEIWQNVTIGKKTTLPIPDKPIIGNNVKVCANAVVIGPIHIGDNSTIGAGAVVNKDIPANSIAVGNPFKILSK